jgi:hypothetical protein
MSTKLKIRYVGEHGIEYTAKHWGKMNDEHTVLDSYGDFLHLSDHGNGVHIEGDRISLDLDYGQLSDIYHVIKAHHDANRYKGMVGVWCETDDAIITTIKPRKRKASNKKKRK